MDNKIFVLLIFIVCYILVLSRKFKIAYTSLGAALLLIIFGAVKIKEAIFKAIDWNVIGIYWGFMMVSFILMKSGMADLIAHKILGRMEKEKYVIFLLSVVTAFLSAFMENVGTVLIMAPIAIAIAKKLKSSLFPYIVSIIISSNIVTTVSMIADPPSLILAMQTKMRFFDFYWFLGKPGLGTISAIGVAAALLSLLFTFRKMDKIVEVEQEKIKTAKLPVILFIFGIIFLAVGPRFGIAPGIIGLIVGILSILIGAKHRKEMFKEFDWNSFFFILGIFVVVFSLNNSGLLKDFANLVASSGIKSPALMLFLITWVSVLLSSFIDNVPYTILMIPVCNYLANFLGISAFPLLFGMIIGTGMGGNITPVGATANIFGCGILEKNGHEIKFKEFLKISLPFTIIGVAVSYILLQYFWL